MMIAYSNALSSQDLTLNVNEPELFQQLELHRIILSAQKVHRPCQVANA